MKNLDFNKIISFLLTLIILLSQLLQYQVKAFEINSNHKQYSSYEDEIQIHSAIAEADINEEEKHFQMSIGETDAEASDGQNTIDVNLEMLQPPIDEIDTEASGGQNTIDENLEMLQPPIGETDAEANGGHIIIDENSEILQSSIDKADVETSDGQTTIDDSEMFPPSLAETNAETSDGQNTIEEDTEIMQSYSAGIDTNMIIVENESEFRDALSNAQYTTIYLGADITMSSSDVDAIVVSRVEPLVINGTDPRENGTRHTYTDYNSSQRKNALGGTCTDITFKDMDIYLRNFYGIYFGGNVTCTVTLDNVTGSARQIFTGAVAHSALVIKESNLTLSNTGQGSPQEFAELTETVNFVGNVTVRVSDSTEYYFFDMVGNSTVTIEEGANVVLDSSANKKGTIFYNVKNFTIDAGASFACYSGKAFCSTTTSAALTNVTIGEKADVRFIHTGGNHLYNSLYGVNRTSTFTAGPGSKFLLYDDERNSSYGAFWFANITLDSVESFVVLNADARAVGNRSYTSNLNVNGVSSVRYYTSDQIPNLFNHSTYAYTASRKYHSWWANTAPFGVTAAGWANAASPVLTNNTFSEANVPLSSVTVENTLTSSNFRQYGTKANGVEIYSSVWTVKYNGNGAKTGTVPESDAGVPNDLITIQDNVGGLSRLGYTFDGWNTAANGTGTAYWADNTFRITDHTTLYAQWVPDKYIISGKVSGITTLSGLPVSYKIDNGETHTVSTDSNGIYNISGVPHGSSLIIIPPAKIGCKVTPANITIREVSSDSTGNDFVITPYTVTEKYIDEVTGSSFGKSDTYAEYTISPYNYSYGGTLEDITAGSDTYIYMGYKAGNYSPGDELDGSGVPELSNQTSDAAVYLIYHKITNTIDVTFPTGSNWEFYVNQDTYPYVQTGPMGSSNQYYEIKNNSDKPVDVDLAEVKIMTDGGLRLVPDASLSEPGSNEYSLNLTVESPDLKNGFKNTVTGIIEDTYEAGSKQLIVLDGQYIKQPAPTAENGYITIGGYYTGNLYKSAKNPQLMFTFRFSIIQ